MEDHKKSGDNESIQVIVRCRPLNRREKEEKCDTIVDMDPSIRQLSIKNPAAPTDQPKTFTYDGVFDETTQQKFFYEEACFPLIESVLEGFNATIFAYGQTGSGKSWTMQGDASSSELRGVMPNAFSHIFEYIQSTKDVQFLIRCSYLEIYNEEIRDLLHVTPHNVKGSNNGTAPPPIKYDIRDDPVKGVYVQNLTNVVIETEEQMMKQLEKGLSIRTVAETLMNDKSSRSHSIFTVIIEMSTKDAATGKDHVKVGKLNLVDLAGSERQKKTGAVGKVLKEGAKINLSLLTLGCVISALADGKSKHIQYRDSKLTRLLQDSLGGNTKTCMVAAISPAESNYDETLSTLRYANNAKNIKNKPRINEDPKDAMIREFKEEIERLKKLLMAHTQGMPAGSGFAEAANAMMMANLNSLAAASAAAADRSGSSNAGSDPQGAVRVCGTLVVNASIEVDEELTGTEEEQRLQDVIAASAPGAATIEDDDELSAINSGGAASSSNNTSKKIISPTTDTPTTESVEDAAAAEEHDLVLQQLRVKEAEVEQERKLREELNRRLEELQNMFVGQVEPATPAAVETLPAEETDPEKLAAAAAEAAVAAAAREEAERLRLEAERIHKERRLKARKRRELIEKEELFYILDEKKALEDELDELRQSIATGNAPGTNAAAATTSGGASDQIEKKFHKIKKKLEKKLQVAQMELDGLKEDSEYQREQLLDALRDEQRSSKLYMAICHALLSDRELNKIIEKCRYDEDDGEWTVPTVKSKTASAVVDAARPSSRVGSTNKGVSSRNSGGPMVSQSAAAFLDMPTPTSSVSSSIESLPPVVSGMKSKAGSPRKDNMIGNSSSANTGSNIGRMPELNVPHASRPTVSVDGIASNSSDFALPSSLSSPMPISIMSPQGGAGDDAKKKKKAKKSKPLTAADNNTAAASDLPDEAGDGMSAGPLSEWGFAATTDQSSTQQQANKAAVTAAAASLVVAAAGGGGDLEYYSDDDFEEDGNPSLDLSKVNSPSADAAKKKKKQKRNKQQQQQQDGSLPVTGGYSMSTKNNHYNNSSSNGSANSNNNDYYGGNSELGSPNNGNQSQGSTLVPINNRKGSVGTTSSTGSKASSTSLPMI